MQCPKCAVEMDEVRKLDVVVDSWSRCGGLWLDRGELDKLRSTAQEIRQEANVTPQVPYADTTRYVDHGREAAYRDAPDHGHRGQAGHKRKKSVLDLLEIFD